MEQPLKLSIGEQKPKKHCGIPQKEREDNLCPETKSAEENPLGCFVLHF